MANIHEYNTVVLAGLLHDIGKLLGRGQSKVLDKSPHPKFSADFVSAYGEFFGRVADINLLKELVQRHHENQRAFSPEYLVQGIEDEHHRTLAKLVSLADNLASSERGQPSDQYQDFKSTPLCTVMERLDNTEVHNLKLRFHPLPLPSTADPAAATALFPAEFVEYEPGEMNGLLKSFGENFAGWVKKAGAINSFDILISQMTNILYAHSWCIPSNTQEQVPDVSLFDHLKLTAAIAACLHKYHTINGTLSEAKIAKTDAARFLIASGDISGIQSYIFDITDSTVGGVARMLRARSMFVQACSEVAAHRILHELNLPLLNVIMNSGGNFYLLLPNVPDAVAALQRVQGDIDRWFMTRLNGELSLNLAWHSFVDGGFKAESNSATTVITGFGGVLQAVKTKLNQRKENKFREIIQAADGWREEEFIIPLSFKDREACPSCHKYPVDGENRVCGDCDRTSRLGSALPKARFMSLYRDEKTGQIPVLGYSVSFTDDPGTAGNPYLVTRLNEPQTTEVPACPATFKYVANHVPLRGEQSLLFEEIAEKAEGQALLGILKADVDRLGEMFVFGLKGKSESWDTISRLATLSRQLDVFFTGWLQSMVSSQYPECYMVYSGGDDLFIVGPWNQVLALSLQVNADFARFTGNPQVTISAGITVTKPGYPIARAARDAEKALKAAKDAGRNRVTVLDRTLTWHEYTAVIREWEQLKPALMDTAAVPTSIVHGLLAYAGMWQSYREGNIPGFRYHPLLTYSLNRNVNRSRAPIFYEWLNKLLKWPPGDEEKTLDNLSIIARLCLFMRRGGKQ